MLNALLENGKMKTNNIFINVASYNEEDLFDTIDTAFSKASFPENIYVGACLQYTDNAHSQAPLPRSFVGSNGWALATDSGHVNLRV